MLAWIKDLLYDKATFTQYIRTAMAGIWFLYDTGQVPEFAESTTLWYISRACLALAFLLRAGDKNIERATERPGTHQH